MKASLIMVLTNILMATKSYGYIIVDIEDRDNQSHSQSPSDHKQAKLFEIDDDQMGPILPKEIERNRLPASIPTDDENGHTKDKNEKY